MALKKQLRDKDGNLIYPDVGIDLDEAIYGSDPGQVETPSPWIETGDIKDAQITTAKVADGAITTDKIPNDSIKPYKLKGYATTNTTDTWVPVSTSDGEMQHRIIAPFNADGTIPTAAIANSAVTNAKIDWTTTTRPLYYTGKDWATSWTFKYYRTRPQLIFVAWQNSVAMFARIYDIIYKVFQSGGSTITATINTSATTWTITTSNTGVLTVLEMNNIKPN